MAQNTTPSDLKSSCVQLMNAFEMHLGLIRSAYRRFFDVCNVSFALRLPFDGELRALAESHKEILYRSEELQANLQAFLSALCEDDVRPDPHPEATPDKTVRSDYRDMLLAMDSCLFELNNALSVLKKTVSEARDANGLQLPEREVAPLLDRAYRLTDLEHRHLERAQALFARMRKDEWKYIPVVPPHKD
jgi:hypothetical protein